MLKNYFTNLSSVKKSVTLFIVSGLCLGFGSLVDIGWPLGLFGVYIFLFALSEAKTFKQVVFGSYLAWVINLAFVTSIFWSIYPIEWIDLGLGNYEFVVIGSKWFITSIVLGTGGIVFGLLYWFVRKHFSAKHLLTVPFIWLFAEVSQAYIYSVFVLGPEIGTNVSNSIGYVGYLMASHPQLLMLSKLGGVYALSFIGVATVTTFWFLSGYVASKKFTKAVVIFGFIAVVTSLPVLNQYKEAKLGELVAVIDTEFGGAADYNQLEVWELRQKNLNDAVVAAIQTGARYIILPEDSRFTQLVDNPGLAYKNFRFLNADPEVILIDTARMPVPEDQAYLRSYIYDGLAKRMYMADKQYLTPLGEYLPYSYGYVLKSVGLGEQVKKMNSKLAYIPGPLKAQEVFPDYIPRVLFCFEALNPRGVRDLIGDKKTPFVAHPISHAWFHDSVLLERHLNNTLKIQAVWNHVSIISSANMAKSNLYTPKGEVISPTPVVSGDGWLVSLVSLPN